MSNVEKTIPLYQQIKDHFLHRIRNGQWKASQRVPSENELVQEFGISRMTANRALRELTHEGYLNRVTGVGTFVAGERAHSDLLEIHNIADEIKQRGHEYHAKVIKNDCEKLTAEIAAWMMLKAGTSAFHSLVLHYEQSVPIQLEDRYVNKLIAPDYGSEDFTLKTPNEYLVKVAALQEAEHTVQAIMPKKNIAKLLQLKDKEPCLLTKRRTWTAGKVATVAYLYYPGSRYELSGRFKPASHVGS